MPELASRWRGLAWWPGVVFAAGPLLIWWTATGQATFRDWSLLPPGQAMYAFSKLAALYAIVGLGCQMVYAVGRQIRWCANLLPAWNPLRHRSIGIMVLSLVLLHVVLFVAAVSVRKQVIAWDLLVPVFSGGHYRAMVSLGWIAMVFLLAVSIVALWAGARRRLMMLHRATPLAFGLAVVHALAIGSETAGGLWFWWLAILAAGAAILVVQRWWPGQKFGERWEAK